ncbi:peptidase S41 family protein-like protein [Macroventuria anomochaeta]|uniref:Peptidase S41 family protein-like protein n=1 Tax=Macroventuria anomochaeta TaxID=301207 RepID=A0ACB6RZD0_9PLEO|nr:peptidase S41 family protein-like protein [Macroventuria anomochaeta]KAF2626622.1 peptidase S41 family protein-like protein [Macroventuria anomochaeta]
MRLSQVLSTLIAVAATAQAQSQPFLITTTRRFSSVGDVEPTATETVSGPIQTGQACAQIGRYISGSRLRFPSVEAELAYACLKSVPIVAEAANFTVNSVKQMVEFQSTITYLKDPPTGWPNEPVDILAGLDEIASKVNDGTYTNEYDFENDIAALFIKAHDGHLNFNGMAYGGAFRWRRDLNIALISASRDGSAVPQVWSIRDYNASQSGYEPSPITQIDGQDVQQFLQAEAAMNAYHDPDTRYNALFFMASAETYGLFTSPRFYPGPTTSVTYQNGTTREYTNAAVVLQSDTWSEIFSREDFYQIYVSPQTSSSSGTKAKKRDPNALPFHLENPRDHEIQGYNTIQHGSAPLNYPEPAIAHSADFVPLAGYFVNTVAGEIGVFVVGTFNTDDVAGAQEFQQVTQQFISEAQSRGVTRIIIDVRQNGGGKVLSGYDMYKQFFPDQEPQTQSRWRGHAASEIYGESISSFRSMTALNANLYVSPFSKASYTDANGNDFGTWADMYPPVQHHNDKFTSLLKYNLSDPTTTSSEVLAIGITVTGYNDRASFTTPPFRAEDIVILSDGICASTCAIFLELMVQQSNVRTIAVGGRPQLGPMAPVGGTKGTLVTPSDFLQALAQYVVAQFADSRTQQSEWARFVPNPFAISVSDASVNFQDNIRKGKEGAGVPTQFLNDTASCRIWYEPDMYFNVTSLWEKTAEVAWGNNGALNEGACVRGSVTTRDQQTGGGHSNPSGTEEGAGGSSESEDAAAGLRPSGDGWTAIVVCSAVVLSSMGVGMGIIW